MIAAELQEQINEFANQLAASTAVSTQDNNKIDRLDGSLSVALATVAILKDIVSQATWSSANDLMQIVRSEGRIMAARAGINEMIVGNIVRRVLKIIREDYHSLSIRPLAMESSNLGAGGLSRDSELLHHATSKEDDSALGHSAPVKDGDPLDSLHGYMAGPGLRQTEEYDKIVPDLVDSISQSIDELKDELEIGANEIRDQGKFRLPKLEIKICPCPKITLAFKLS